MDGDVTTGLAGFDAEWERTLAGVMVSQSAGDGTYRDGSAPGNDTGTVESSLTGIYPYVQIDLNARVSAWAVAGAGSGSSRCYATTAQNPCLRTSRCGWARSDSRAKCSMAQGPASSR